MVLHLHPTGSWRLPFIPLLTHSICPISTCDFLHVIVSFYFLGYSSLNNGNTGSNTLLSYILKVSHLTWLPLPDWLVAVYHVYQQIIGYETYWRKIVKAHRCPDFPPNGIHSRLKIEIVYKLVKKQLRAKYTILHLRFYINPKSNMVINPIDIFIKDMVVGFVPSKMI